MRTLKCSHSKEVASEGRSHTAKGFRLRPQRGSYLQAWTESVDTLRYLVIADLLLYACKGITSNLFAPA